MRKRAMAAFLVLAAVVLSGCAAQYVWETVDDTLPAQAASVLEGAYRLDFDVPDDALAPVFSDDGTTASYEQTNGLYEISAQTILSSSLDGVIRRLSGFEPEQVQVLKTRRFGLPEYQFAWYQTGAEGGQLCRADVLCDGITYYALTFSVNEEAAAEYDAAARHVFESIVLNSNSDF